MLSTYTTYESAFVVKVTTDTDHASPTLSHTCAVKIPTSTNVVPCLFFLLGTSYTMCPLCFNVFYC